MLQARLIDVLGIQYFYSCLALALLFYCCSHHYHSCRLRFISLPLVLLLGICPCPWAPCHHLTWLIILFIFIFVLSVAVLLTTAVVAAAVALLTTTAPCCDCCFVSNFSQQGRSAVQRCGCCISLGCDATESHFLPTQVNCP